MWFAVVLLALFAVSGTKGDGPSGFNYFRGGGFNGGSAAASSSGGGFNGGSAAASSSGGGFNDGSAAASSSEAFVNQYPQQPAPARGRPTNAPTVSTTPDGAGTTLNDKNPIGGATANILSCALDNINNLTGGLSKGLKEVVEIFMKYPTEEALPMVLYNVLTNLSKRDRDTLRDAIANSLLSVYKLPGTVV